MRLGRQKSISNDQEERSKLLTSKKKLYRQRSKSESESKLESSLNDLEKSSKEAKIVRQNLLESLSNSIEKLEKKGEGLKIVTPNHLVIRLPILLAVVIIIEN